MNKKVLLNIILSIFIIFIMQSGKNREKLVNDLKIALDNKKKTMQKIEDKDIILTFSFQNHIVTIININSNFWFKSSDITKIFGYSSRYQIISHNISQENKLTYLELGLGNAIVNKDKKKYSRSEVRFLNENGLYDLLIMSRKDIADEFIEWLIIHVVNNVDDMKYMYDIVYRPSSKTIEEIKYMQNKNIFFIASIDNVKYIYDTSTNIYDDYLKYCDLFDLNITIIYLRECRDSHKIFNSFQKLISTQKSNIPITIKNKDLTNMFNTSNTITINRLCDYINKVDDI